VLRPCEACPVRVRVRVSVRVRVRARARVGGGAPLAECPWLMSFLSGSVVDPLATLSCSSLRSTSVRPVQALAPRLSAGEVRLRVRVVTVPG
jgi:hypothetical protein